MSQDFTSFKLEFSKRVLWESKVKELGNALGLEEYIVLGVLNKRKSAEGCWYVLIMVTVQ